jgi:hypothetical protein
MNTSDENQATADYMDRPTSIMGSLQVSTRGFDREESGNSFSKCLGEWVFFLSRDFDLSSLDGITAAFDYEEALLVLDRGYDTSFRLEPSKGNTVGIAMTPSVMRSGSLKSHIVLNASYVLALEENGHVDFGRALQLLRMNAHM